MKKLNLTIVGQLKSGKNGMQIGRNGSHYPKPEWAAWRDSVVLFMRSQRQGMYFAAPCRISVSYWPQDARRRDVPGMADAICHCLERAAIVKDDSLLIDWEWRTNTIDRVRPRAYIEIRDK